jgi:hypothetical protein
MILRRKRCSTVRYAHRRLFRLSVAILLKIDSELMQRVFPESQVDVRLVDGTPRHVCASGEISLGAASSPPASTAAATYVMA